MNATTPSPPQRLPRVRYVGDLETGLVHRCTSDCVVTTSQMFLDVRTALVRGYQLCSCCWTEREQ